MNLTIISVSIQYNITSITMDQCSTFTDIQRQILHVLQKHSSISQIYISIGGKYTEPDVELNSTKREKTLSNSPLQMVPMFLRKNNSHRTLVIVWDTFNKSDIHANRFILDNIQREYRHISYILINNSCTETSINQFIPFIINSASHHQIRPSNFMICNFVKFKNNPNFNEEMAEQYIPNTITTILNRATFSQYKDCFYQWFGYHDPLYGYIYHHSTMQTILYPSQAVDTVSGIIHKYCTRSSFETTVIQDRNVIKLLSNIYNIGQYSKNTSDIVFGNNPVIEFLVDANCIVLQ